MKIVFFGDSITDAGRRREDPRDLGEGYVKIAAGKLRLLYPEIAFEFLNRGVSGESTAELLARTDDAVKESPDVVVLQAGINDAWQRFTRGQTVTEEEFRANYRALVETFTAAGAKVILLEPFLLPAADKQRLRPQLNAFNAIIREIAREKNLALIPADEIFAGVTQDISPDKFARDGIHPTHRGCRYLADLVIKELKKIL